MWRKKNSKREWCKFQFFFNSKHLASVTYGCNEFRTVTAAHFGQTIPQCNRHHTCVYRSSREHRHTQQHASYQSVWRM